MQRQTQDKASGMGKAAEAVLGLVDAIESHQEEDTKRKNFCEVQSGNNENSKTKIEGDLVRLKARQEFLESEVGTITTEVDQLKKEAEAFTARTAKLEAARAKEKAAYKESSADRELTVKVVQKAKVIVERFYKSKDPQGLIQRSFKADVTATNATKKERTAPPETWTLSSSRKGGLGQSVIAMLETILWDFSKEQSDADKEEKEAVAALDKIREDTKELFDKKIGHVSRLLQEKARDAQELTQVKADSELKTASLVATKDALSKLDKECTELIASYDKVAKERQRQMMQLKDVADILGGATVGARTGVKAGLLALESLQA